MNGLNRASIVAPFGARLNMLNASGMTIKATPTTASTPRAQILGRATAEEPSPDSAGTAAGPSAPSGLPVPGESVVELGLASAHLPATSVDLGTISPDVV